jgi:hypothetical protein
MKDMIFDGRLVRDGLSILKCPFARQKGVWMEEGRFSVHFTTSARIKKRPGRQSCMVRKKTDRF